MQDAVTVFAKAFGDNVTFIDQFNMNPTSCYNYFDSEESTSSGKDILAKVDEVISIVFLRVNLSVKNYELFRTLYAE